MYKASYCSLLCLLAATPVLGADNTHYDIAVDLPRRTEHSSDIHVIRTDDTYMRFVCPFDAQPMIAACHPASSTGDSPSCNWIEATSEIDLPAMVEVDGRRHNVNWKYIGVASTNGRLSFTYRSDNPRLGCCSVQTDTTQWSPAQRTAAKQQFTLYKNHLRPLIASANLYHLLPRPDGKSWDGIEYFDPDAGRGVLIVFRPETRLKSKHVVLRGLDTTKLYSVTSVDGSVKRAKITGKKLTESGLEVNLPEQNSSDFIFFTEIEK